MSFCAVPCCAVLSCRAHPPAHQLPDEVQACQQVQEQPGLTTLQDPQLAHPHREHSYHRLEDHVMHSRWALRFITHDLDYHVVKDSTHMQGFHTAAAPTP